MSAAARAGLGLTPADVFQYQTVEELALVAGRANPVPAEAPPAEGEVPLTPIQSWFLERPAERPAHFNQAVAIGLPRKVDVDALAEATRRTFEAHGALRLRFERTDEGWRQFHAESLGTFEIERVRGASDAELHAAIAAMHAGLDLSAGPLVRAALFDRGERAGPLLVFVVHHLIVDGVSWRILLDDLSHAYRFPDLPVLQGGVSFRAWSEALVAARPLVEAERDYWRAVVAEARTAMPGAPEPAPTRYGDVETITRRLPVAETERLTREIPRATEFDPHTLLLTSAATALAETTGAPPPTLAVETHGRDARDLEILYDASRTVGWFTALHPFTPEWPEDAAPIERVRHVRSALEAVPAEGLGYGLLRYSEGGEALAVRPAVGFNYLGQLDAGRGNDQGLSREPVPGPRAAAGNERPHRLDLNAWISGGEVTMEWEFVATDLAPDLIERVADEAVQALKALVAACLEGGDAPVPGHDLEASELAAVLAQVRFGNEE